MQEVLLATRIELLRDLTKKVDGSPAPKMLIKLIENQ